MEKVLKNRKIQKKLIYAFRIPIIGIIAVILMSLVLIVILNNDFTKFYKVEYTNSTVSMEIRKDLQYVGKLVLWSMTTDDKSKVQQYLTESETSSSAILQNIKKLEETYQDSNVISQLDSLANDLVTVRKQMTQYASNNENDKALDLFNNKYAPSVDEIQTLLIQVGNDSDEEAVKQYKSATFIGYICLVLMIAIGVVAVVSTVRAYRVLTKILTTPIYEIQEASRNLKNGQLDNIEITYQSEDEFGELSADFNDACKTLGIIIKDIGYLLGEMSKGNFKVKTEVEDNYVGDFSAIIASMRNLRLEISNTILSIDEASEQVSMGAEQLAASAQTLAESTTEQAGAIEEITATVESVSEMANEISTKADVAYSVASDTAKHAADSQKDLIELTDAMEKITYTSQEIANIIGSIEDIASQTNLLSLNASIEAARAGEAGKGFAVVADQIGKLATDSANSAVNTRNLIEASLHEIENGNRITKKTVDLLNDILTTLSNMAESAKGSSEASSAQAETLKQIEQGIEQISGVVQSNSASAQETSATSEELSAQAETLKQLVNNFDLER